jgi:hypothetical protein
MNNNLQGHGKKSATLQSKMIFNIEEKETNNFVQVPTYPCRSDNPSPTLWTSAGE